MENTANNAFGIKPVTEDDLNGIGVIGMEDIPELSKDDMQYKLEETARQVIIPLLNELINSHNKLSEDVSGLALGAGQVTPSQIERWDAKLDATPESYRRLTKFCVVGGSAGWFKAGSVQLTEASECYSALLLVQSVNTNNQKGKTGCISVEIRLNAERTGLDSTSHITWSEASEFNGGNIMVTFDAAALTSDVYIRTDTAAERIGIAVLLENNPTNPEHLLTTANNDAAELTPPAGLTSKKEKTVVLLWENASPASVFAEQTIKLDLSSFSHIAIDVNFRNSENGSLLFITHVPSNTHFSNAQIDNNNLYVFSRSITVSQESVAFGKGYFTVGITPTADDGRMIPLKIYGIKGDLA